MGPTQIDINTDQLEAFGKDATKLLAEQTLRAKYAKQLEEEHGVSRKSEIKKIDFSLIMKSAAAVTVIFISIFGFNKFNTVNSSQVMAFQFIEDTYIMGNQQIMRKGKMNENELRIKANKAYVMKDYSLSIDNYMKLALLDGAKMSDLDYFYLGISQLKQEASDPKAAIANFLLIKDNSNLSEELNWMLSLAYIVNDEEGKAKELLTRIVSGDGYKASKALEILKSLK